MPPKPKQITLKGRGFAAGEMLSLPILKSVTTDGPGPGSANVLRSMGWNGKIVGSVVLWLSNDNTSVSRGQFSLLGEFLPEPLIIPAKKLWPNISDTISLSINLSSPDLFLFPDSLTSEYVDESDINHLFFRNNIASNSALTDEELITAEVGSFCLRMFIYPSSSTFVSFSLLIYPDSVAGLKDHALASNPKWPGLLLSDGKIPLLPASTSLKLKWGSPVLPLIIPGASWDLIPSFPPTADFLFKLFSILRNTALPETKRLGDSLLARWEALDREGAGALDSSVPAVVWPEPPTPTTATGESLNSFTP